MSVTKTIVGKIMGRDLLAKKIRQIRSVGRTVAMCYGTFDLYHVGHVHLLEQAKEFADALVVVVESLDSPESSYPLIDENHRALIVASHECADFVVIDRADDIARLIQPDFIITSFVGKKPPCNATLPMADIASKCNSKFVTLPRKITVTKNDIIRNIIISENEKGLF